MQGSLAGTGGLPAPWRVSCPFTQRSRHLPWHSQRYELGACRAAAQGRDPPDTPKAERRGGREWLQTLLSRFGPITEKAENTAVLDFEKPLVELDNRINEVRTRSAGCRGPAPLPAQGDPHRPSVCTCFAKRMFLLALCRCGRWPRRTAWTCRSRSGNSRSAPCRCAAHLSQCRHFAEFPRVHWPRRCAHAPRDTSQLRDEVHFWSLSLVLPRSPRSTVSSPLGCFQPHASQHVTQERLSLIAVAKRHVQPSHAGAAAASGAPPEPANLSGRRSQHHSEILAMLCSCSAGNCAGLSKQMFIDDSGITPLAYKPHCKVALPIQAKHFINTSFQTSPSLTVSHFNVHRCARCDPHPGSIAFTRLPAHPQDKFVELHGDRAGLDDPAMVCGIGSMDGISFMFIGHQKGRNTKVSLPAAHAGDDSAHRPCTTLLRRPMRLTAGSGLQRMGSCCCG